MRVGKAIKILGFVIAIFFTTQTRSSHLLGGEITWECVTSGSDAGKFIFQLKLYASCHRTGIAGMAYQQEIINPLYNKFGGPSTISVHDISRKDFSPGCYSSSISFPCVITSGVRNPFSVKEVIYKSAPTTLVGTPDSSGSNFVLNTCCGVYSGVVVNMPMGGGIWIRSKMFPFMDTLTGQYLELGKRIPGTNKIYPSCYDSSPKFAEGPVAYFCLRDANTFQFESCDPGDSMTYAWDSIMYSQSTGNLFDSTFSYDSPLPGKAWGTNNVPAQLDTSSGAISFQTFGLPPDTGLYRFCVAASSFKSGQLTSIVYRELIFALVDCDTGTSSIRNFNAPKIELKETSKSNYTTSFRKTYRAGSKITLDIRALDFDFLPTNPPTSQSVTLGVEGVSMSDSVNDSLSCQIAPCAYLDSSNKAYTGTGFQDTNLVSLKFYWNTSCANLRSGDYDMNGIGKRTFCFTVKANDNWCTVPRRNTLSFYITLVDSGGTQAFIDTIDASTGDVKLNWNPFIGTGFTSYELIRSNNSRGPWSSVVSIGNQTITSHSDQGSNSNQAVQNYHVYINRRPDCEQPLTKRTIRVTAKFDSTQIVLDWNKPYSYTTLYRNGDYYVYRKDSNQAWRIVDTSEYGLEGFIDIDTLFNRDILYKIVGVDPYGLYSVSNVFVYRKDTVVPQDSVPIDTTSSVENLNKNSFFQINIYPIPAQNELFIELSSEFKGYPIQIDLINNQGKICYSGSMNAARTSIDLTGMTPGVYLIRLRSRDGQVSTGRFILSD